MMDFGFGSFLDKFEEHFGRIALRALLFVIGVAVATFCLSMIWQAFLQPIAEAVWIVTGESFWQIVLVGFWMIVGSALGVFAGIFFAATVARWRSLRWIRQLINRVERVAVKADERQAEAETLYEESRRVLAELRARADALGEASREAVANLESQKQ